jgi:hypothetical protein
MVSDDSESLVQPHLWSEERLVWYERPTKLGAVVACVSYAYKKADSAVEFFSAPLGLFVGIVWVLGVTPLLIFLLWVPLGLGLAAVVVALVAACAAGVYGWLRGRRTCYAITDRRVLAVHASEEDWTLHEAWDSARVTWKLAGIGTVVFSRRGEGDLDVRFAGVRDPTGIVAITSRAALARKTSRPPA